MSTRTREEILADLDRLHAEQGALTERLRPTKGPFRAEAMAGHAIEERWPHLVVSVKYNSPHEAHRDWTIARRTSVSQGTTSPQTGGGCDDVQIARDALDAFIDGKGR